MNLPAESPAAPLLRGIFWETTSACNPPVSAGNVRLRPLSLTWQRAEPRNPDALKSLRRARAFAAVGDFSGAEPYCTYEPKRGRNA